MRISSGPPPVALVTGANKGIGFHIARQLAQHGHLVLMGCRDQHRGNVAADQLLAEGLTVEMLRLDVTDDDSIAAAARRVHERHGRLDVLVNNAGISSGLSPTSEVTVADLRLTFEANVFGLVAVTNAFLHMLRAAQHGRVVNLSSELGSPRLMSDDTGPFADLNNAAYQSSKSALNMLTVLYAKELADTGIAVNAVGPGYRSTDLSGGPTPGAGDPADGATVAVQAALDVDDRNTGRFLNHRGETVAW